MSQIEPFDPNQRPVSPRKEARLADALTQLYRRKGQEAALDAMSTEQKRRLAHDLALREQERISERASNAYDLIGKGVDKVRTVAANDEAKATLIEPLLKRHAQRLSDVAFDK